MTDAYDLVAIGAGPAGESATELASFFGHRSAVIERARPGGTVTTTGGAPTKTLREAALYFSGLSEGDVYGVRIATPPEIATDIIRKRTRNVCDLLQKVTAENIANNNVDYIQGSARLDQDGSVMVTADDGQRAQAARESDPDRDRLSAVSSGKYLVRHTRGLRYGYDPESRPGAEGHPYRGGGPVGVEFATICHALGTKVTLLDRGTRLMSMMDGEALGSHGRTLQEVGHHNPVWFDAGKRSHEGRWPGREAL